MSKVPTLSTERFTMRALQRGDEHALFATLGDPEQCLYLTRPAFASPQELWGWLADPDWPGRSWIAGDGDGAVAGRFVASAAHADDVFEIGYIVCTDRQGAGVARECTSALIAHLWSENSHPPTRKLTAEVDARNTASIRLLERLGFTREAHLREHEETHIGMCDVYWYGLLKSDLAQD